MVAFDAYCMGAWAFRHSSCRDAVPSLVVAVVDAGVAVVDAAVDAAVVLEWREWVFELRWCC